jgi:hypothetical protein
MVLALFTAARGRKIRISAVLVLVVGAWLFLTNLI